ncbi:uncharacterized protein K460DRAFT_364779 [Cucurbitaria berberidis CBS 394.84]|uniref:Sulfotransferase domain-containing protein n=1 Tax=Cucurbitaria berberidis CBS 394.84 TaxID=1168544 RepID=A0A9P4LB90_9PLEO|nr:uncharacterized protein K460DRAFT_364779 [Cucurbitaria berberidis CBS 394.84]KAF1848825.1 hypothetical protein K460DRAFT_364779 [Cucurbitaria berberidis CBS 394.84]
MALPPPLHNILFTIPRTASNLVTQLLNLPAQPSISRHPRDGYFFLPALSYRYKHDTFSRAIASWTVQEQTGMRNALQTSLDAWKAWIDQAEREGKGTFIKEHVNWMIATDAESHYLHEGRKDGEESTIAHNPTCVPDVFLLNNVRATFLVRHPALTFPSLLRSALDNEGVDQVLEESTENAMRWEATYHWHVAVYKFLTSSPRASNTHRPLILDASDLSNPDLVRKYAVAVGLDPELVRFEWDAVSSEEQERMGSVEARMKDTLLKSRGVVLGKLQSGDEVDVGRERENWSAEFGEVLGERLVRFVDGAMGDYEWLWDRRLRV